MGLRISDPGTTKRSRNRNNHDCNTDTPETGQMSTEEEKLLHRSSEMVVFLSENCAASALWTDTEWITGQFFIIITLRTSLWLDPRQS